MEDSEQAGVLQLGLDSEESYVVAQVLIALKLHDQAARSDPFLIIANLDSAACYSHIAPYLNQNRAKPFILLATSSYANFNLAKQRLAGAILDYLPRPFDKVLVDARIRFYYDLYISKIFNKHELKWLSAENGEFKRKFEQLSDIVECWENAPFISSINSVSGKVLRANRQWRKFFVEDPAHQHKAIPPATEAALKDLDKQVVKSGKPVCLSMEVVNAEGNVRNWEVHRFQLRNRDNEIRIAGFAQDISGTVPLSNAPQQNEAKYAQMFAANKAPKLLIDPLTGKIEEVNPAACEFYGHAKETFESMYIQDLSEHSTKEILAELANALNQEQPYIASTHRIKSGETKEVGIFTGPLNINERQLLYAIVLDLTGQNKVKLELEQAKILAEEANRLKSEFLANMSHEIRTPMNSILGFAQLLQSEVTDPKQQNYLKTILSAGKGLKTLINDILDFSKIEAGRMEISPNWVSIRNFLQDISDLFSERNTRGEIGFTMFLNSEIPDRLKIDEARLRQVVVNLIGNAFKFTIHGFVQVEVGVIQKTKDTVELSMIIEDTGIGISPEDQEKIFDSFSQLDGRTNRKFAGTGLGLAICKKLVSLMGGKLELESEVGVGSKFILTLPEIRFEASSIIPGPGSIPQKVTQMRGKVLVVDDVEANRIYLNEVLLGLGFTTSIAIDGFHALEKAESFQPDLIFMDLRMPGMTGQEAAQKLQEQANTGHIPVVGVTAAYEDYQAENEEQNFDRVLLKPVNIEDLKLVLNQYFSEQPDKEESLISDFNFAPETKQTILKEMQNSIKNLLLGFNTAEMDRLIYLLSKLAKERKDLSLIKFVEQLEKASERFEFTQMDQLLSMLIDSKPKVGNEK